MSLLIDTNVISEVRKGDRCQPLVARWYASVDSADLFLSVLVLGEIRRGAEAVRPRDPSKALVLDAWLSRLATAFGDRLPVDAAVADTWGRLSATRSVSVIDGLLAATAIAYDFTLVTRNESDVAGLGARVLNPFLQPRPSRT